MGLHGVGRHFKVISSLESRMGGVLFGSLNYGRRLMECASCGVGVIRVSLFGKARCDNCSAAPSPEQRSELEKSKSTNSVSSSVSTTPSTLGQLAAEESSASEVERSAESSQPSPTTEKKPTDSKTDGTEASVELPWWTSLVSLVSAVGAFEWLLPHRIIEHTFINLFCRGYCGCDSLCCCFLEDNQTTANRLKVGEEST